MDVIELGIDLDSYDDVRSIGMREARALVRGRGGSAALEVVRRWASPHRGCRPLGDAGPVLVLPAIKVSGQLRTMPEWVEAFERKRQELGRRRPTPTPRQRPARSREAGHRRAERSLDREGVGRKRE